MKLFYYFLALMGGGAFMALGAIASKGYKAVSVAAFREDIRNIAFWWSYVIVMFCSCVPSAWVTLVALDRSISLGATDDAAAVVVAAIASYFLTGLTMESTADRIMKGQGAAP